MAWLIQNIGLLVTAVLGAGGLLILYYDWRMRMHLLDQDQRASNEIREAELTLRREQFEHEKQERRERMEWLHRETLRLQEVGGEKTVYCS